MAERFIRMQSFESVQTGRWKRELLKDRTAMFEKLHGNAFQIGLPDAWVIIHGQNAFVEFKIGSPRTVMRLVALARPRQRLVLARMGHRDAMGFMVVRKRKEDLWAWISVRDLIGSDAVLEWMGLAECVEGVKSAIRFWKQD